VNGFHAFACAAGALACLLWGGAARAAAATGAGAISVTAPARQTITIEAGPPVGDPVERAVPGRAYPLAVAKDREERWSEAAALYQQAAIEWTAELRLRPSPVIERAVHKAERERQRSQMLASLQPPVGQRSAAIANRSLALERARLYRTKLMVVRAYTGAVPTGLYARARHGFGEALQTIEGSPPSQVEIRLLLCATRAAGGEPLAARLELAQVPRAQRQEPAHALPLAICHAALGNLAEAQRLLESVVLRLTAEHRVDASSLRELYLANDWDRLRGGRRFEALFAVAGGGR
jgi:hypothetical protein